MGSDTSQYQVVVGLEVHIQLLTESKLFASDPNSYGNEPNTNVSVITLAHPGTLPRLNKKAVEYAIKMGLACNSEISRYNIFDRKNYFYPDLPKGFQTTQDSTPICLGGSVEIVTGEKDRKVIRLNRIHLEEDAGKSIHVDGETDTLIDLNRAGVPLIELVTEPVIHSSEEAMNFLNEIRKLVDYLEICDGNMEEGSLRCDANISVRKNGEMSLGKKVEVKNMNSVRNVGRAIQSEVKRQVALIESGESIISETRLFDAEKNLTYSMRMKEELNDYRYFPEPDIAPFTVSEEWLSSIEQDMPILPQALKNQLIEEYGLPEYDAAILTESKDLANYFYEVCIGTTRYKAIANWIIGPIKSYLNEQKAGMEAFPIPAGSMAKVVDLVEEGKVSFSVASKKLFPYLIEHQGDPENAANKLGIIQETSTEDIRPIVVAVLEQHPEKVKAYQHGKKGLIGMFMGEVMKKTGGSVDPKVANQLLAEVLNEMR